MTVEELKKALEEFGDGDVVFTYSPYCVNIETVEIVEEFVYRHDGDIDEAGPYDNVVDCTKRHSKHKIGVILT